MATTDWALAVIRRVADWSHEHHRNLEVDSPEAWEALDDSLSQQNFSSPEEFLAGGDGEKPHSFWYVVAPLLSYLVAEQNCSWAGLGLQFDPDAPLLDNSTGSQDAARPARIRRHLRFHYRARREVLFASDGQPRHNWRAHALAGDIHQRRVSRGRDAEIDIALTTELVIGDQISHDALAICRDGSVFDSLTKTDRLDVHAMMDSLVGNRFTNESDAKWASVSNSSSHSDMWYGAARDLATYLGSLIASNCLDRLRFARADEGPQAVPRAFREYLEKSPSGLPSGLRLATYLSLMTYVWPRWRRILVVPARPPVRSLVQAAALVICEDESTEPLGIGRLADLSAIVGAATAPWHQIPTTLGERAREREAVRGSLYGLDHFAGNVARANSHVAHSTDPAVPRAALRLLADTLGGRRERRSHQPVATCRLVDAIEQIRLVNDVNQTAIRVTSIGDDERVPPEWVLCAYELVANARWKAGILSWSVADQAEIVSSVIIANARGGDLATIQQRLEYWLRARVPYERGLFLVASNVERLSGQLTFEWWSPENEGDEYRGWQKFVRFPREEGERGWSFGSLPEHQTCEEMQIRVTFSIDRRLY